MEFVLCPPEGVGEIRLGMTRDHAKSVLSDLGDPKLFSRDPKSPPGWMLSRSTTIFVYCGAEGLVDAIEFATPGYGTAAEDRVAYEGISVFDTPAETVLADLRALGTSIYVGEGGHAHTLPDLLLVFWRDGGPVNDDGMPQFFESVLLAAPGYYDQ